jgi:ABC-2 type transport system permease protein
MIRALFYLRLTSLRNKILTRALRLRQPKYLGGALATAAYFYYFAFRRNGPFAATGAHAAGAGPDIFLIIFSITILILLIGRLTAAWALPPGKPALRFTQAEIAFLFPAPATRRLLVHYSLLSSQLTILFGALLLGLAWSRRGFSAEGAAMHVAGWWILISATSLHRSGANLTFTRMAERGGSVVRGKLVAIGIIGVFFAAIAVALDREGHLPSSADLTAAPALARYFASLLDLSALRWLLWPFRMLMGPFLAPDGRAFLLALGPALLLLAAHYLWVFRLEMSISEGSTAFVPIRAQPKVRPGPFRLAAHGRPEVAFLWKNLISISSKLNWRKLWLAILLLVQAIVIGVSLSAHTRRGRGDLAHFIVAIAAIMALYVLFFGAQLVRQDLRNDLGNTDILKTYPLRGWQVMLGELLTPIALLSSLLWILLFAAITALSFFPVDSGWQAPGVFLTAGFCAACTVPPVCALELLVPNAAMLLFPAWHQATRFRTGGVDMIGQRLVFVLGQFLVVTLMLLPAVLAAPIIVFVTQWLIGLAPAIIAATGAVLAIIGAELWVGLWLLGARFEKLDIAAELRP